MSRNLLLFSLCLMALACACSDHKCPPPYMTFGDTCRLCPPGQTRERGMCVPIWDGGDDAVEADDAGEDEVVESDAGETTASGDKPEDEAAGANEETGAPCYHDLDGDGVGAGEPVDCEGDIETIAATDTDCDDNDPARSPSLSDICGDGVDNDCDETPDDDSNNACGGPCGTQLGHQPGEVCDNGLKGACARSGEYECSRTTATTCSAPSVTASDEVCGDGVDNDCDGNVDESDATDAKVWYEDCDVDGYSGLSDALIASGIGIKRACLAPPPQASCAGWTDRRPIAGSTWDCDDASEQYRPGAGFSVPPDGKTSHDLDCDGVVEKEDAIVAPVEFWAVLAPYKRCSASLACQQCLDANPSGGTQWLSGSQPTDTQPRCSTSLSDGFAYRSTAIGFEVCANGNWGRMGNDGVQQCR